MKTKTAIIKCKFPLIINADIVMRKSMDGKFRPWGMDDATFGLL